MKPEFWSFSHAMNALVQEHVARSHCGPYCGSHIVANALSIHLSLQSRGLCHTQLVDRVGLPGLQLQQGLEQKGETGQVAWEAGEPHE